MKEAKKKHLWVLKKDDGYLDRHCKYTKNINEAVIFGSRDEARENNPIGYSSTKVFVTIKEA